MPEEITKARRVDLWKVKYSQLALHPNVREDLGEIDELTQSIKLHGVKNSLRGYRNKDVFCVIDGSRRYAAMEAIYNELGTDIECSFICQPQGTTDEQILLDQFTTNDGGKPLTPLEQAYGVKKFIEDFKWNTKKIADKLCKSEVYIKRLLSLVNAPADFIALVKKKDISATFAMEKIAEGKAHVEDFMKTHKDGGFNKYEEKQLFEGEKEFEKKEGKQAKITKKDLTDKTNIPNSWNEFKKYSDKADYLEMWEGKIYSPVDVFQFLLRLKNNEIVWDDIKDFFRASTEPKEKKVKDDIQDILTQNPINDNGETVVREYPK